jgi:hypothetical protein
MFSGIFLEGSSRAANPSRLHDSNAPRLERESLEKAAARAVVYVRRVSKTAAAGFARTDRRSPRAKSVNSSATAATGAHAVLGMCGASMRPLLSEFFRDGHTAPREPREFTRLRFGPRQGALPGAIDQPQHQEYGGDDRKHDGKDKKRGQQFPHKVQLYGGQGRHRNTCPYLPIAPLNPITTSNQ